ncbi:translation initiation factor IF-2-like [Grus americana]|uniref:translation initiation factor IF-2-like n=1 Tax=Grus americana TaxID=9117 RepID=UPI0024086C2B|nr:translation initiation factor IF-2-like [Grus americana]
MHYTSSAGAPPRSAPLRPPLPDTSGEEPTERDLAVTPGTDPSGTPVPAHRIARPGRVSPTTSRPAPSTGLEREPGAASLRSPCPLSPAHRQRLPGLLQRGRDPSSLPAAAPAAARGTSWAPGPGSHALVSLPGTEPGPGGAAKRAEGPGAAAPSPAPADGRSSPAWLQLQLQPRVISAPDAARSSFQLAFRTGSGTRRLVAAPAPPRSGRWTSHLVPPLPAPDSPGGFCPAPALRHFGPSRDTGRSRFSQLQPYSSSQLCPMDARALRELLLLPAPGAGRSAGSPPADGPPARSQSCSPALGAGDEVVNQSLSSLKYHPCLPLE